MSLILDALNKADRERSEDDTTPSYNTSHSHPTPPPEKPKKKWIIYASLTAFITSGFVLAYVIGKNNSAKTTPNTMSSSATKQPPKNESLSPESKPKTPSFAAAKRRAENRRATTAQAKQKTPETNSGKAIKTTNNKFTRKKSSQISSKQKALRERLIAAQYQNSQASAKSSNKTSVAKRADNPSKKTTDEVSSLYQKKASPQKKVEPTQQTTAPKADRPNRNTPGTQLDDYPNIGTIRDLPTSLQDKIPTLTYSEHNYKASSGSSITINNKKIRKGGALAPGIQLQEILRDGIILRYQTHKIKMRALSSWVNI